MRLADEDDEDEVLPTLESSGDDRCVSKGAHVRADVEVTCLCFGSGSRSGVLSFVGERLRHLRASFSQRTSFFKQRAVQPPTPTSDDFDSGSNLSPRNSHLTPLLLLFREALLINLLPHSATQTPVPSDVTRSSCVTLQRFVRGRINSDLEEV